MKVPEMEIISVIRGDFICTCAYVCVCVCVLIEFNAVIMYLEFPHSILFEKKKLSAGQLSKNTLLSEQFNFIKLNKMGYGKMFGTH